MPPQPGYDSRLMAARRPRFALPVEWLAYFREVGAKGGKVGGAKSWAKLTPEQRSARAKHASQAAAAARTAKAKAKKAR